VHTTHLPRAVSLSIPKIAIGSRGNERSPRKDGGKIAKKITILCPFIYSPVQFLPSKSLVEQFYRAAALYRIVEAPVHIGSNISCCISSLPSWSSGIDSIASRNVGSIAKSRGSRRNVQVLDCSRLNNDSGHFPHGQVPADMAVQRPHSWVVCNNANDGVRTP